MIAPVAYTTTQLGKSQRYVVYLAVDLRPGDGHGHIGQAGDSGVGQVATVRIGRVTRCGRGSGGRDGA